VACYNGTIKRPMLATSPKVARKLKRLPTSVQKVMGCIATGDEYCTFLIFSFLNPTTLLSLSTMEMST